MSGVDSMDLPPLQYLVLEVVGARFRLGHNGWTLHTKVRPAVVALADGGLVDWKEGVAEHSLIVWLTNAGKSAVLSEGYVPPILTEKVS